MMKWRAIVGAAGLVGALVVLHVLFFSSRIAAWNQMEATALQNVAKYKEIVGDAKLSLFNDTVLRNWLREKEKEIATTKESFDQIRTNYPLVILPESDVSADYTMVLFNETIKRLDALEKFENSYRANPDQGVPYDRVRVLDDLDVKSSMAPGRFGMGFSTRLLRFPVYYLPMYYQKDPGAFPKQGAIEFFFKPDDWSTPDDRRARSLFYARGPDRVRPSLIPGAQNVYRPEITIYKDAASMLHFEITDIDGNGAIAQPGFLDAQNGFSPQRFTYVSCVWNGNVLRMYVNGRDITGQGAPMTPPGLLGYGTEGMIGVGAGGARDRIRAMMGGGYGMEMGPPGTYPGGPQPAAPPSSGRGPELLEFASLGLGGAYTDPFQNQADGVFDDLRIKKVGQPSPPPTAGGAPIPGTMFLDTFEGELVSREELNSIIDSIGDNLRFIRTTSDPSAQRPYIDKMENLRACCGLSTARLATLHPSVAFVRRVHIFRELNRITGRSLNELFRTFCWLPPQEVRNPHYEIPQPTRDDMETYVGFLQLSLELLQDAMREDVRVDRVTAVSLEGEDLFPDYAQLEAKFKERLNELMNDPVLKPFCTAAYQFKPPPQEWFDMLPELAMQQPEITNALYGASMMDATAMASGGEMAYLMMNDPAEQERQYQEMERKMNEWVQRTRENVERLEKYLEAWRKRVIPPKVRDEVRLAKLQEGNVTYKKRSVRINFECNATALANFFYAVEYGNNKRLANVESYDIVADDNANLTVSLTVDFHQVRDVTSGPMQLPPPTAPQPPVAAMGIPPGAPGAPVPAPEGDLLTAP